MSNSRGPTLGLLLLCVLGSLVHSSSATTHEVSWTVPANLEFYDDLAATQVFHVGDIIEFVYEAGTHNVLAVSPKDAASCDSSNPIQQWDEANPKVSLDTPGTISFICGFTVHCSMGMSVTLTVLPLAPVPAPPAPQLPPPTKPPTKPPTTPATPEIPPPTKPPTAPATPELPSSPPPLKRRTAPEPEVPVPAPTRAPIPSPPKKKNKKSLAPAPAPLAPASPLSGLSAVDPNLAPAPLPETAGASVVRSTALVIAATLLVSCYAILL